MQRFTPLLIDAARPCRHSVGDRWFVDETYVRVAGLWRYVNRAVDQYAQVIDVYVSKRRDITAATKFLEMMLAGRERPTEVTTDLAAPLLRVVDDLLPEVLHDNIWPYRAEDGRSDRSWGKFFDAHQWRSDL